MSIDEDESDAPLLPLPGEGLFARFVMSFDDDQDNSFEDYKSAATIIRFNKSLMKSSGLEP